MQTPELDTLDTDLTVTHPTVRVCVGGLRAIIDTGVTFSSRSKVILATQVEKGNSE